MTLTEAQLRELNDKRRRARRKELSMAEARQASVKHSESDSGLSLTDYLVGYSTGWYYNLSFFFGSLAHKSEESGSRSTHSSVRSFETDRSSSESTGSSHSHGNYSTGSNYSSDSSRSSPSESSGGYSSGGDSGGYSSGGDSGSGGGGGFSD
jgi:hypothetical protein